MYVIYITTYNHDNGGGVFWQNVLEGYNLSQTEHILKRYVTSTDFMVNFNFKQWDI